MPNPTPSPEHAKYEPLVEPYMKKCEQQEKMLVKAGLPARGVAALARRWFDAWAKRDLGLLADCMTEDVVFTDSSTFGEERHGRELTLQNCEACFDAFPDMVFYPQDGTQRSLPYYDFLDDVIRMTVPWRGIGRFSGTVRIPPPDGPKITGTGRCLNFIGVDRYIVEGRGNEMRIARIDTDWDMLGAAFLQLAPVRLPLPRSGRPSVRVLAAVERLVMPGLRALDRAA
jgi:hypothetical protein